jgi:hypothetical protein
MAKRRSSRGNSSRLLTSVSHEALRRASPAENLKMGFSAKARRYVKASISKVTKATASVSARQAETKRTKARYGYASPEQAPRARQSGALHYESRRQGEIADKTKQAAFLRRLRSAGQTQKTFTEHDASGAVRRYKSGKPRRFKASADKVEAIEAIRERKLAGEFLDQGEWFFLIHYAEALHDPALPILRASPGSRPDYDHDFEVDDYEE